MAVIAANACSQIAIDNDRLVSALPPKAAAALADRRVRQGPRADIASEMKGYQLTRNKKTPGVRQEQESRSKLEGARALRGKRLDRGRVASDVPLGMVDGAQARDWSAPRSGSWFISRLARSLARDPV
jgi:hypothetical protein